MDKDLNNQNDGTNVMPEQNGPAVQDPMVDAAPKKKKGKGGLIIVLVLLVLLAAGGAVAYFMFFRETPYGYFKKSLESLVSTAFENTHDDDIFQLEVTSDIDVQLGGLMSGEEQKIIDFLNKVFVKGTAQIDTKSKKMLFKINTTYDNEKLLDGSIYVADKIYLYAPEYYDKYLYTDESTVDFDTSIFEKKYDYKTIEKVLKTEIVKLISEDECTKEDGYYVLKISNKKLVERLYNIMLDLKNNKEFAKAIGEDVASELFEGIVEGELDLRYLDDSTMTIKAKDDQIIIENEGKITINIKGDTYEYSVSAQGQTMVTGKVTIKGDANDRTIEMTVNIPIFGSISVKYSMKYTKLNSIDNVDVANAVNAEDISEEDANAIATKFKNSKLYDVVEEFMDSLMAPYSYNNFDDYDYSI